jgi:hypothetical protein
MNIIGKNVGKTNITSTYTDNISRSDSVEFTVTAVSLGTISSIDNSVYTGSEIRPLPIINAVVNGAPVELQNGRDYTLEYTNNINASTNETKATVTATGIGNFTGKLSQTWDILPKVVTLQWGETSWMYDGNEHSTTCVVTNLVSGDECTVVLTGNSITNIAQSPVTVTVTGLSGASASNYTLTGASNKSVQLTLNPGLFVKISGEWTPVKEVYRRESGNWVKKEYADWNGIVFNTGDRYVKKN